MSRPMNMLAWTFLALFAALSVSAHGSHGMKCKAYGPLSTTNTVAFGNCKPGVSYTCIATDSTGCDPGDPSNIESLVVRDPSNAQPLGGSASVAKAPFTCPQTGMVSCAVVFTTQGKAKASHYRLKIVPSGGGGQQGQGSGSSGNGAQSTSQGQNGNGNSTQSANSPGNSGNGTQGGNDEYDDC
ncbi:uncharacterized protein FOMMEDRAFT_160504 [Fomitiporia mediterranea MF3/22]|uniref:uncharacterized protein n=1 Tax=Fomitiporia mediterranea (strain MF3/22) TaxID=694068 RepID=UPI0004409CA7|nr:uncharacterized protein FOMMEDRAFT_160504 [Fomitiporia mediterranea MF3/22]EJC99449.1 hypothetical protein FOMMEDRAFT_160504 [Fomitiporia mediterranea MF3/22]